MSGYGIAADETGNLFFVTGNSDYSGTTYDGVTDIQESVIEVSGDLTQVLDLFTPDDWSYLDQGDIDYFDAATAHHCSFWQQLYPDLLSP